MPRRVTRLVLWTLAVATLFAPAASSATSPNSLYSSTLNAGIQQKSVHYTSVLNCGCPSAARIVQVSDVARNQGIQRIAVTANGQTGHVTVLVTGGNAYVLGDSFALTNYMGYKADAAATYSERWIRIPLTDPDFDAVAADVTLRSSMVDLYVPQPIRLSAARVIDGKKVVGLTGTTAATATSPALTVSLYARKIGLPLPVEEDVANGTNRSTTTFSHWNERVRIATPADATPIATTGLE